MMTASVRDTSLLSAEVKSSEHQASYVRKLEDELSALRQALNFNPRCFSSQVVLKLGAVCLSPEAVGDFSA